MIGRGMVTLGFPFTSRAARALAGTFAVVAMTALASGCVVTDAAGLGEEEASDSSTLAEVGYDDATGGTETEEQSLVLRRGHVPDYAESAGPQPDPWRAAGPQPDPWTPTPPGDPPKPGNGKD